jgi:hypothetical protein
LTANLSERSGDIDRWPDNDEWYKAWMERSQYRAARQGRLIYILEMIEQELRTERNEDIEIKSALSIEHIMPISWQENWLLPGYEGGILDEFDIDYRTKCSARNGVVNTFGNLTMLTQKLNSSVSNGPYSVKMPAIRAHSSLALNRDLNQWNQWNEETILKRGEHLFKVAKRIWSGPTRSDGFKLSTETSAKEPFGQHTSFPDDGTRCEFTYGGKKYVGEIVDGKMAIEGIVETFGSFSAASHAVTKTSRNGWNDWYLEFGDGSRLLADHWRKAGEE